MITSNNIVINIEFGNDSEVAHSLTFNAQSKAIGTAGKGPSGAMMTNAVCDKIKEPAQSKQSSVCGRTSKPDDQKVAGLHADTIEEPAIDKPIKATRAKRPPNKAKVEVADTKDELPLYVEEFNRDHFIAYDGSTTRVFREVIINVTGKKQLVTLSFSSFRNQYSHQLVEVMTGNKVKLKQKATAWLEHPSRRQYRGVVMAPLMDLHGYYNLWDGFAVEPAHGSWRLMKDHILSNICANDPEVFKYVMGWMSVMVQKPDSAGQVALVLKGGRGTGKGVFGSCLCDMLGQHSCHVTQTKHVTGHFNGHLKNCVLLFADEAFCTGDKRAESVLKTMITEPLIAIEQKGKDVQIQPNMLHIVMASNNDWVVPAGLDERRFCVLNVSSARQQDHSYFSEILKEMAAGGLAAMLNELQEFNLNGFEVRDVPQTQGLLDQKRLTLVSDRT